MASSSFNINAWHNFLFPRPPLQRGISFQRSLSQINTLPLCLLCHSVVSDSATPGTVAHQAPLSMEILQARILEWVAMPSSRGFFPTQGSNPGFPHRRQMLCRWATREASFTSLCFCGYMCEMRKWQRCFPYHRGRTRGDEAGGALGVVPGAL